MRITDNIAVLPLSRDGSAPLNLVLIWDHEHVVLIDAGLPGQLDLLREAMKETGFTPEQLTEIILTHQDLDHVGLVRDLREAAAGLRVLAHEDEAKYIQFDETPIKLAQREKLLDTMTPEQQEEVRESIAFYKSLGLKVDQRLADGEVLPYCGGLTIIHTPGHTPGHAVVYANESGTLICGDALNISGGRLAGANPVHTYDPEAAAASLVKLRNYDVKQIVAYHGGVFKGDANAAIKELTEKENL
jgi:glyoxylase-like metal-dependent hydrolase (beta-lactamase superfamily II)